MIKTIEKKIQGATAEGFVRNKEFMMPVFSALRRQSLVKAKACRKKTVEEDICFYDSGSSGKSRAANGAAQSIKTMDAGQIVEK